MSNVLSAAIRSDKSQRHSAAASYLYIVCFVLAGIGAIISIGSLVLEPLLFTEDVSATGQCYSVGQLLLLIQ